MSDLTKRIAQLSPEKRQQLLQKLKAKGQPAPESIPCQPRDKNHFALSYAQERLWYLEQLDPGNHVYNFPFGIRFDGPFDVDALRNAFTEMLRRHEILRTTFRMIEGQPVQVIGEPSDFDLACLDLSDLSEKEADDKVDALITEVSQTTFDLNEGPLLHAILWRRHEARHGLMICMHHIITDGWSKDVFTRELTALYDAFSKGEDSPLADLPIQYADFSVWQRDWLEHDALQKQHAYWKQQLADSPKILELPTDRPRPSVQTFPGDYETFKLSPDLSRRVKELSNRHGATLFMTVLTVFKIVLQRYTGREDIVVGTPVANRTRPEIEGLIGFFVNNLVLRTDLADDPTFVELLEKVRETALCAYENQDIPFEKLVEDLQPERDLSTSPLFQVMFIMLRTSPTVGQASAEKDSESTASQPLLQNNMTSKFDLTLYLEEEGEELFGTFEYNTDLFHASTMKRMGAHFVKLMHGIVDDPDRRISEYPILTEDETERWLVELNATVEDYPAETCLHQLFEQQVARLPERPALEFENQTLSYEALNARANQLAHHLRKSGIGPKKLVGIYLERSPEMMIALLGVLKAGAGYVPLDPAYPEERLQYMIEDAGLELLLTQESLSETLGENETRLLLLDGDWQDIARENEANPEVDVEAENLAYVIYTSGSTGKPKGVMISHRALVNFLCTMGETPGLTEEDVLLAVTTLSFDIAGLELYLPLLTGAKVVLASREMAADARRLAEKISACGATVMQATPATWRMLLDTGWGGQPGLKMLCGGEALPKDLAERLLPCGRSLWNMYGPTETTIWSMVQRVEANETVSLGRPIANTQIFLLDKQMQPVPTGVYGELYIGGDGMAHGYLNRPDLTAERFVPNPFGEAGERLYRTGDQARFLANGDIEFLGRLDFQVKVRGFRIELGEIEAVCEAHAAVKQAVVVPHAMAEGDIRLVAYVQYTGENEPTVSELRRFMKEKLPDYMVPSLFVTVDSFPQTPNGKVDRKRLPVPTGMASGTKRDRQPPHTEMEKFIATVWGQILGSNGFSIDDNFFDLGGHSLLSMKVLYRIEQEFGLRINPREIIFKNLGQLASYCEELIKTHDSSPSDRKPKKFLSRIKQAVLNN